ncbi:MAG: tRNA (adenosine(37)-N6)-threonylcarbamoyltransferase complex transferase subunit TsaD [Proteobacteria bacterium]|nr:tRNA (adenosine(37)-N6)-threonylcarbamoyltransferase complex transferase subunit TsaD [Pseudomonadota bacterium]
MKILGIETSCDETSASVIVDHSDPSSRLLSNVVLSQIKEHERYGGVIPEIAARNHLFHISSVVEEALTKAKTTLQEIDYLAVTAGPGLIGGVLVGVMYAKGLSQSLNVPLLGINHLEGHALVPRLLEDIPFPFLLLLVSGGHCQFLEVKGVGHYKLLGSTIDDAIGEAFDKVAKMMNLPYPGGPALEKLAKEGNENAFDLPKPLYYEKNANLSFSGLKTAIKNIIDKNQPLTQNFKCNMASSFQKTVAKILQKKTTFILEQYPFERMVIAGGVAANQYLKSELLKTVTDFNGKLFTPPLSLCTDNAAMIAWAGIERLKAGYLPEPFTPRPRWPLS